MIQAVFNLNQDRIARTLCVEKDIQDSNCGGCCQLKKTLSEENTDAGTIPVEQKQSEMVVDNSLKDLIHKPTPLINECIHAWPDEKSAIHAGVLSSVFHPPDLT